MLPDGVEKRASIRRNCESLYNRAIEGDCETLTATRVAELSIRCVAAPIWDHTGTVNASLSITGPVVRMQMSRLRQLVEFARNFVAVRALRLLRGGDLVRQGFQAASA
jgi:hypothetical protein